MADEEISASPPQAMASGDGPIPDDEEHETEMPMTMAASVVLTSLPKDATTALKNAGELAQEKVTIRFQPVGSAPALSKRVFKVSSRQRFETVVNFLRKKLGLEPRDSVFCYVNSVFAPGLDENVGNLWRCFKVGEELVIAYARMPAFG